MDAPEPLDRVPCLARLNAGLFVILLCAVKRRLKQVQDAIGRSLALPLCLWVAFAVTVLLRRSRLGSGSCAKLGNIPVPFSDFVFFEAVDRPVAKAGQGESLQSLLGVSPTRMPFQVNEIFGHRLLDRVPFDVGANTGPHIASGFLRLPEIKNGVAIGVLAVVARVRLSRPCKIVRPDSAASTHTLDRLPLR